MLKEIHLLLEKHNCRWWFSIGTTLSQKLVYRPNSSSTFRAFTQQADYVPNESMRSAKFMKGGKRTNKKRRTGKGKKAKRSRNNQKRSKSKSRRTQRGSGSSDWRSTLYSRGSYIAPNMPAEQFRAFTKQADYLPNESMRSAAFMK